MKSEILQIPTENISAPKNNTDGGNLLRRVTDLGINVSMVLEITFGNVASKILHMIN